MWWDEYKVLRIFYIPAQLDNALNEKLIVVNEQRRKDGEEELNRNDLIAQILEEGLKNR